MKAFVITLLAVLGVAVASCGPAPFGGACGSPCGSPCGGWGGWGFPGGGWGGCGFPGGGGCGGWGWGGPVGNTWNNFGNQNAACAQGAATQFGRGMNVVCSNFSFAASLSCGFLLYFRPTKAGTMLLRTLQPLVLDVPIRLLLGKRLLPSTRTQDNVPSNTLTKIFA